MLNTFLWQSSILGFTHKVVFLPYLVVLKYLYVIEYKVIIYIICMCTFPQLQNSLEKM